MQLSPAPDISRRMSRLVKNLDLPHIRAANLICFRSTGSTGRARARIWSLPKIWQMALSVEAHYCIEVISEKFDNLSLDDQERTLIHELLHIPKNFSGALVPHRNHKHRSFRHYHDKVETLFQMLKNVDTSRR
ncbi:MAG: putative metallopeptidase [Patescibacteria group bacterium]